MWTVSKYTMRYYEQAGILLSDFYGYMFELLRYWYYQSTKFIFDALFVYETDSNKFKE